MIACLSLFYCWPLCCLSFFRLRLLFIPLVSSNISLTYFLLLWIIVFMLLTMKVNNSVYVVDYEGYSRNTSDIYDFICRCKMTLTFITTCLVVNASTFDRWYMALKSKCSGSCLLPVLTVHGWKQVHLINTTGVTSGSGTAYPSRAPGF